MKSHHEELALECAEEGKVLKTLPRPVYWGIISGMVLIATVVISADGKIRCKTDTPPLAPPPPLDGAFIIWRDIL